MTNADEVEHCWCIFEGDVDECNLTHISASGTSHIPASATLHTTAFAIKEAKQVAMRLAHPRFRNTKVAMRLADVWGQATKE